MILRLDDILSLEKYYRRNLINSISGYKSANLIATHNEEGQSNLAIFSSMVHVGATPPLQGIISRPDSVPRHTLENIRETGFYTINHVHEGMIEAAHQSSARYEGSEFEATGLTECYLGDFPAPFVKESKIKIGLALKEILPIQLNGTYFIIGQIVYLDIADDLVKSDGLLDLNAAKSICVNGLDEYHLPQKLARFSYAKPDKPLIKSL